MARDMSPSKATRPYTIEDVKERLQTQGANPNALWATCWKKFGDRLAKDIGLCGMTWQNLPLKKAVRQCGGIAEMWRVMFPVAASYAAIRYGHPGGNVWSQGPNMTQWSQHPSWQQYGLD